MSTHTASNATSYVVQSSDGTPIAVTTSGTGRPLVLVPGTTADHTSWRLAQPDLETSATVHAVDRRGRGASGDHDDYSVERELADVVAVVEAAAATWGGPVDLVGHSFGGMLSFGAAARTDSVRRMVLYEGWPPPDPAYRATDDTLVERLEALLAEGRRAEVVTTFFQQVVGLGDDEIRALQSAPSWPGRVGGAHTVPREMRAFSGQHLDPATAAAITVPVLLLVGGDTPSDILADPEAVAAALADARIQVLPGQAHVANTTAPHLLADAVLGFLDG